MSHIEHLLWRESPGFHDHTETHHIR